MAAGVVSGVVADLLQKYPTLNPDQVKARLMKTAWSPCRLTAAPPIHRLGSPTQTSMMFSRLALAMLISTQQ